MKVENDRLNEEIRSLKEAFAKASSENRDLREKNTNLGNEREHFRKNWRNAEKNERKAKKTLALTTEKLKNCEKVLEIGELNDANGKAHIFVQELNNSGPRPKPEPLLACHSSGATIPMNQYKRRRLLAEFEI